MYVIPNRFKKYPHNLSYTNVIIITSKQKVRAKLRVQLDRTVCFLSNTRNKSYETLAVHLCECTQYDEEYTVISSFNDCETMCINVEL